MGGLRFDTDAVVRVGRAGLELTDDLAEQATGEQPGTQGTGRILADRRQVSQGGSDLRGHLGELPADLLVDGLWPVGCSQSGRLGRIRGRTKSMSPHVRDGRRLAGSLGGGHRGGSRHGTGSATDKAAADPVSDVQLPASERPRPGDQGTGAAISRSVSLKHYQHPLRAVRRPRGDDPPITVAQSLRRTHTQSLPRV